MPAISNASNYTKARQEIEARLGIAEFSGQRRTLTDAFKTVANTLKAQVVEIGGSPTGGTFTLAHGNTASSAIAYDAAASAVESALDGIAALTGFVSVAGAAGGPWTVTASRDLLESLLIGTSSLTGGSTPSVEVTHLISEVPDRDQALEALFAAAERSAEGMRSVPAAPATNFTPASLSSVVLWLDAQYAASVLATGSAQAKNGEAVVSWLDRIGGSISFAEVSGSGPNLIADSTGPNGTRYIRGNGSSKYLRYAASSPLNHSAGEVFIVLRPQGGGTQVPFASADEASTTRYAYIALGSTGIPEWQQNNAGTADRLRGEDRLPLDTFTILNIGSSGTTTRMACAGGADHTLTAVTGANDGDWFADATARDNVTLFALQRTSVGSYFDGDIAEVIVTNAALTTIERARILAYLKAKYTPCVQIAAFGDSHTEGPEGTVNSLVPLLAAATKSGVSVVNHGVGSETISEIRTRWTSSGQTKGYDVLMLLAGTNDVKIASAGDSVATLFPLLEKTYDEAIAAGMKVVAITVYPFFGHANWSAVRQTELDILNRLIRDKALKNPGVMGLVDAYAILGDPNEPRKIRTEWDYGYPGVPNALHTNVAGDNAVAAVIKTLLDGLL